MTLEEGGDGSENVVRADSEVSGILANARRRVCGIDPHADWEIFAKELGDVKDTHFDLVDVD